VQATAADKDGSPAREVPLSAFCIEVALRPERQDVVAARVAA